MNFHVILLTLKNVLWSFFGEKVIAKFVWWFLEYAAKQSTNQIDDKLVAEAKSVYYGKEVKK